MGLPSTLTPTLRAMIENKQAVRARIACETTKAFHSRPVPDQVKEGKRLTARDAGLVSPVTELMLRPGGWLFTDSSTHSAIRSEMFSVISSLIFIDFMGSDYNPTISPISNMLLIATKAEVEYHQTALPKQCRTDLENLRRLPTLGDLSLLTPFSKAGWFDVLGCLLPKHDSLGLNDYQSVTLALLREANTGLRSPATPSTPTSPPPLSRANLKHVALATKTASTYWKWHERSYLDSLSTTPDDSISRGTTGFMTKITDALHHISNPNQRSYLAHFADPNVDPADAVSKARRKTARASDLRLSPATILGAKALASGWTHFLQSTVIQPALVRVLEALHKRVGGDPMCYNADGVIWRGPTGSTEADFQAALNDMKLSLPQDLRPAIAYDIDTIPIHDFQTRWAPPRQSNPKPRSSAPNPTATVPTPKAPVMTGRPRPNQTALLPPPLKSPASLSNKPPRNRDHPATNPSKPTTSDPQRPAPPPNRPMPSNKRPSESSSQQPLSGLTNLHNSCYVNAAVHLLAQTPNLQSYRSPQNTPHVASTTPIYDQIGLLWSAMRSCPPKGSCSPRDLLAELSKESVWTHTRRQEDASDFLLQIIRRLSKELDTNPSPLDYTILSVRTTYQCTACHHQFSNKRTENMLILKTSKEATPENGALSLKHLLSTAYFPEEVHHTCQDCNNESATRQDHPIHTPQTVFIVLPRHANDASHRKDGQPIQFPASGLDLKGLLSSRPSPTNSPYRLIGMILHHGPSMNQGHYTAYTLAPGNRWTHYNDQTVTEDVCLDFPTTSSPAHYSEASVLLYSAVPPSVATTASGKARKKPKPETSLSTVSIPPNLTNPSSLAISTPVNVKDPDPDKLSDFGFANNPYLIDDDNEEVTLIRPDRQAVSDIETIEPDGSTKVYDFWNEERDPDETICTLKDNTIQVQRRDMVTLNIETDLNDVVINGYLHLITKQSQANQVTTPKLPKVWAPSTFFYPKMKRAGHPAVKRWTNRLPGGLFSFDIMIVPVHINLNHWACGIIDFRKKSVELHDSLGVKKGSGYSSTETDFFPLMRSYLSEEAAATKTPNFDISKWTDVTSTNCPQQDNINDCGVFLLKVAHYRSLELQFNFDKRNMPYFRALITLELARKGCFEGEACGDGSVQDQTTQLPAVSTTSPPNPTALPSPTQHRRCSKRKRGCVGAVEGPSKVGGGRGAFAARAASQGELILAMVAPVLVSEDRTSQFVAPIMHAPDHAKHWKYVPPRTQGAMGHSEDRDNTHHDTDGWLLHDQKIAIFSPLPLNHTNLSKCTTDTLKAILQDILNTEVSLISPHLFDHLDHNVLANSILSLKPPHFDLDLVKVHHSVFDKSFLGHPDQHPMWYRMQCSRSTRPTPKVTPILPSSPPLDPIPNTAMELRRSPNQGLTVQWFATRDIKEGEELFFDYGIRPAEHQHWEDQVPEAEAEQKRPHLE